MRKYQIADCAYFRKILFVVGDDSSLNRFLKKFGVDRWTDQHWGMYFSTEDDHSHYILLTNRGGKKDNAWRLAALGHEVMHLVFDVFRIVGIEPSTSSEEAFTYYFQSMYSAMLEKL